MKIPEGQQTQEKKQTQEQLKKDADAYRLWQAERLLESCDFTKKADGSYS